MRVAVIGGGAAGMAAAWNLQNRAEVTLFESDNRLGGHVDTHSLLVSGRTYSLDSAFTVYNPKTYPEFSNWLAQLEVETQQAEASFSVRNVRSGLEYGSSGLAGLFSRPKNLFNWRFLEMLRQLRILRQLDADAIDPAMTLGELLEAQNFGESLVRNYLEPLCATTWSLSSTTLEELPAQHVLRFMNGYHLRLPEQGQWRVISGGSRRYVDAFVERFSGALKTGEPVLSVRRDDDGIEVVRGSGSQHFDAVVLACHPDQALKLLDAPSALETEILGAIRYRENRVVVHSDPAVMPLDQGTWASWNALVDDGCQVTYWLNRLQSLSTDQQFFVTLNPQVELEHVWSELWYRHPEFSQGVRQAQQRFAQINGQQETYFCGAYWGWGSHEDAFVSGARAAGAVLERRQVRQAARAERDAAQQAARSRRA
jgi:predicted NAD/FAD-binding protein